MKQRGIIFVNTQNNEHDAVKLRKVPSAINILKLIGIEDPHVYTDLHKNQMIEKYDLVQNEADLFEAKKKTLFNKL